MHRSEAELDRPMKQTLLQRYWAIIKFHGSVRGVRRVIDQATQVDLYDWMHSVDTRTMLAGDEFFSDLVGVDPASVMHYQPTYTATVRQPLKHLVAHFPVVGASSACLIDLGCGSGKVLHIGRSIIHHATMIGVDLHPGLLAQAAQNLGVPSDEGLQKDLSNSVCLRYNGSKTKLILGNVGDIPYEDLLAPFDVVIVHNKNSFDKKTTASTLSRITHACTAKALFYLYNNPVFEDLFTAYPCVFQMHGWHKNWNAKVFRVS
jgi:SAM-dependent methyltransferase